MNILIRFTLDFDVQPRSSTKQGMWLILQFGLSMCGGLYILSSRTRKQQDRTLSVLVIVSPRTFGCSPCIWTPSLFKFPFFNITAILLQLYLLPQVIFYN